MVTAAAVMEMLVKEGFATEAKMKAHKYDGLRWKSPSVKGLDVSDETFGSKSFLFFRAGTEQQAEDIAVAVRKIGGEPDFAWNNGGRNFSLRVSAFKGYHHWE